MKNIILIGAGGHAKSCIDVIEQENKYKILGLLDIDEKIGQDVLDYKIIDCDRNIKKYINSETEFLITLGSIEKRVEIYEETKKMGAKFAKIISPLAYVSNHSVIESGTIVMHGAIVNSGAKIAENCIINSKSLIEHECIIEDNCHISIGVVLAGNVKVLKASFIGANATIVQGITIPEKAFIKAGSLVK